MNTAAISLVCLTLSQVQPSQFDPSNPTAPIRPSQDVTQPDSNRYGASNRFTDPRPAAPSATATISDDTSSQLRPSRSWATADSPQSTATRAQAQAPIVPVHSTNSEALAAMILEGALNMRVDDGTNVALVDVLSRIPDRSSRQRAVQVYWQLTLAMASRNFARHETRYLSELPQPQSDLERLLLDAEVAEAQAREATIALTVFELQEALRAAGRLELDEAARPVDRPFVGKYHTDFQALFANRTAPARLKQIDRRLPHQLAVIERRAEAVAAGERASEQLADAYKNGTAGLTYVLDSLNKLSKSRRDLLDTVLSYNEQIAEYSLAVVRSDVPVERLLGTLIRRDTAARPTMVADANIRRASAEAPIREEGEVDGTYPLRPTADPQTTTREEPLEFAPTSRSILKRITIDHP